MCRSDYNPGRYIVKHLEAYLFPSVPGKLLILYGGTDFFIMFPQQGLWTEEFAMEADDSGVDPPTL